MGPGRGNSGKLMLYEFDFLPIFAGAERGSRISQSVLNRFCERVHATEHAPRDPFSVLESRHGLAEIVERGAVVQAERPRVNPPHLEREHISLTENTAHHEDFSAHQ